MRPSLWVDVSTLERHVVETGRAETRPLPVRCQKFDLGLYFLARSGWRRRELPLGIVSEGSGEAGPALGHRARQSQPSGSDEVEPNKGCGLGGPRNRLGDFLTCQLMRVSTIGGCSP